MSYDPPPPPGPGDPAGSPYGSTPYGGSPYGGSPYGGGPYGAQPPGGGLPAPGPKNSGLAIAAISTGIPSLLLSLCCLLFAVGGIAAAVMGGIALKQIADSQGRLAGRGLALTGIITGALAAVLGIGLTVLAFTGALGPTFTFDEY